MIDEYTLNFTAEIIPTSQREPTCVLFNQTMNIGNMPSVANVADWFIRSYELTPPTI